MRNIIKDQMVIVFVKQPGGTGNVCEFVGRVTEVFKQHSPEESFDYMVMPVKILQDQYFFLNGCMDEILVKEEEISFKEPAKILMEIL